MSELRDFVYIDDVSLNNHLSSLGRGVPAEITRSSEGETEKSGEAGAKYFGIGATGRYAGVDRNTIETTLDITAPYRFQDLLESLADKDIDIHKNPDPRSLARGDVVRIEGVAKPMSLFKIEVAVRAMTEVIDSEMNELLKSMGADAGLDDDVRFGDIDSFQKIMKKLAGNKLPVRMVTDDSAYGVALDREHMRMAASRAFFADRAYTLFGRVNQRIVGDASWDPILATSILNRYISGISSADELKPELDELAYEMNLTMEREDWELSANTATIQPIAMFW